MGGLIVLPIVLALGLSDPCDPPPPGGGLTRALQSVREGQLFNNELNLSACVSQHMPRAIRRVSREQIKARVREACVSQAFAGKIITPVQARALGDSLVDREIDLLTRCRY
jgi:hypothetical protein